MANFFKKKGGGQVTTSGIHMTDSEAALAQSDFNIEKITEIQNKFTGGMILLYPGRIFIREGLLWKVCRKGPKKRQFFLFNDILVYGSVVANRYSNQHILPLSQMSVSSECFYQPRVDADFDEDSEQMELDVGNAFQISHANKSFHVFALSSADKNNWLTNLHKRINRVSQSLSGDNQLVTRAVWVPDSVSKECMVCGVKFTAFVRKHHCRRCGRVVCSTCSPHRVCPDLLVQSDVLHMQDSKKLERVCKDCFRDMSSMNSRGGGVNKKPPPAFVAAQIVSNVLQSVKLSESTVVEEHVHDSSTDTEDSDDSDNEPTQEIPPPMNEIIVSSLPEEPQPTPPPRKKKLKKKLEQLVEKQLNNEKEDRTILKDDSNCDDTRKPDLDTTASPVDYINLEGKEPENKKISDISSPKRSRRRKKHNVHCEYEKDDRITGAEDIGEITVDDMESKEVAIICEKQTHEVETKKTRSRKNKFQ